MEWNQIIAQILGTVGVMMPMFLWLRSEANSDRRDMMKLLVEMKDEMKDFHGRLCAIEERNKK
jgi:hypothetical protein